MEILLKMKVEKLQEENQMLREEMNKLSLMYKDALLEINSLKKPQKEQIPERSSFKFEETKCRHANWLTSYSRMSHSCQDCGKTFSMMQIQNMSISMRKAYGIEL